MSLLISVRPMCTKLASIAQAHTCTMLNTVARDETIRVRIIMLSGIKYWDEPKINRRVMLNLSRSLNDLIEVYTEHAKKFRRFDRGQ